MCGISGIYVFSGSAQDYKELTKKSIQTIKSRGPDASGFFVDEYVSLGHARLSIIDISSEGNQPMTDPSGRYTIIFNGEILNYQNIARKLINDGVSLITRSDTEVLLQSFIRYGRECLPMLEGFYAFAIYDNYTNSAFIARDRFGVKPLVYYVDQARFIFASEIKGLLAYGIKKEINKVSLYQYLQLNYIPAPNSIFKNIQKLEPGNCIEINKLGYEITSHYLPINKPDKIGYEKACLKAAEILEEAVVKRLVSDVPVGAFLSGGLDSSIVTGLASRHQKLHTFSIGFKDYDFFNETYYAKLASKAFGTEHTIIELSNKDIEDEVFNFFDYLDEPFGDSSALAYYILSKKTSPQIKVALTGDGADEVFGGYNKHLAEAKMTSPNLFEKLIGLSSPLLKNLPSSRHSGIGNKIRKAQKFALGMQMDKKDRYWRWCSFIGENDAMRLLNLNLLSNQELNEYEGQKQKILKNLNVSEDLNEMLLTDIQLVLANDMLTKIDISTMSHGQEARNPFLDHKLVEFALSLPAHYKITRNSRKKILYDTFKELIPSKILSRQKKGFEIPVRSLIIKCLDETVNKKLLNREFLISQGLFNPVEIHKLITKFYSSDPSDTHASLWGLIIFQHWWEKYYK
jgi:asparagine synthase (glutamine-hydrolysing)